MSENLGTSLIEESDRVRIWEHRDPAGETGPTHLHRRPYLSVVVHGSKGDTLDSAGSVLEQFTFGPGAVFWIGEGQLPQTHALHNTGDDEILIVTAELL
jgi:beta-alanine degradation protein BauB